MESREPNHGSDQQTHQRDNSGSSERHSFIRSDSEERRRMMEHYAKQGQHIHSQAQGGKHQTHVAPLPPGYMPAPYSNPMMQQMQMPYGYYAPHPSMYYPHPQMHMMYPYPYQQMNQQMMTQQNFYPAQNQPTQNDPSTTQKQWPSSYQFPNLDQGRQTFPQHSQPQTELNFQIASGDDSDSIFEQAALGQKYEDNDCSYSDNDEAYGDENEEEEEEVKDQMPVDLSLKPQKLPLETIMEENSVMHQDQQKLSQVKPKYTKPKTKNTPIPQKEHTQVTTQIEKQPSRPVKIKHKYPEMSEAERKLAEADAYLRKLHSHKPQKVETHVEENQLSQLSSWTGESLLNIKGGAGASLEAPQPHPTTIYKATLPDKEQLLEDILVLRQTKNVNEEQIRLLKVSVARLKKYSEKLQDQIYTQQFDSQPEWVKYREPNTHLMQVNDLEGALEEIRRLKKENNQLIEQRQFYKVSSEKYHNRALYLRKKFATVKPTDPAKPTKDDASLRLKNSQLKAALKKKSSENDNLKREIGDLKSKSTNFQQQAIKYRQEVDECRQSQKKLTTQLLKLETDKKKKQQLEVLKKHIEDTMRQDDEQRMQDLEVTKQIAAKSKQRTDQIDQLEEFGEFLTENASDEELHLMQSDEESPSPAKSKKYAETGSANNQDIQVATKDYVAATLNAWNNCPGIVKKQLDKQANEILELNSQIKELNLKLTQRRTDFERQHQTQLKTELMQHKEKIESIYREKLDEEKRKLLKGKVDEIDRLIKENKRLNQQIQSKW